MCLLDVLKNVFGEVDEAMFQGVEKACEQIFCILRIEKTTWTKLNDVLSRRNALRTNNPLSRSLKNDFDDVDEAMFQGVESHANPLPASCLSKKATWKKSLK
jgi:hypothetical protein